MKANIIIFVEDRPETVIDQIALLKNMGFEIKKVSIESELFEILKTEYKNIALIVMDIMLYGIKDLNSIGISGVDTDGGYEAGWALVENILRSNEFIQFHSIPVIILSNRKIKDDTKRLEIINSKFLNAAKVFYIEKGGEFSNYKETWDKRFENIVNNLMNEK